MLFFGLELPDTIVYNRSEAFVDFNFTFLFIHVGTKGCNILHRLQVYHLTLTFIIHNKYTSTLYLYIYIHIPIDCSNNNAFYCVRYKLLGTYI